MPSTAATWRTRASDLRKQAARSKEALQKEALLKMAESWDDMARSRERILALGGQVEDGGEYRHGPSYACPAS